MSFRCYKYVAENAWKNGDMFPHLFLILCWNLLARCINVSKIMIQHMSWSQDAMVIVFPEHKGA
jgi:hypothetical protein